MYVCFYILEKSKQLAFCLERLRQNVIATKRFPSSVPTMRCNDMLSMISVNIAAQFTSRTPWLRVTLWGWGKCCT